MSTTEYRLLRRGARTADGDASGEVSGTLDPTPGSEPSPPGVVAAGSQRLAARIAGPAGDDPALVDADTAEIELAEPEPFDPRSRVLTEPMPADELALALAATFDAPNRAIDHATDDSKTLAHRRIAAPAAIAAPVIARSRAATADLARSPGAPTRPAVDEMPITAVSFGAYRILVIHRGDEVELILPGGVRLSGPRTAAAGLAEALLRGVAPR